MFLALDIETTMNGNEDVGLAHPMHPNNSIVAIGFATSPSNCSTHLLDNDSLVSFEQIATMFAKLGVGKESDIVFCGQNIGFDLMYLYNKGFKKTIQQYKIWDIQLAEYILTAQQSKFASLDELSVKYCLPLKADEIKKYFEAGIGADRIPWEELEPYLKQDVLNTYAIAEAQVNKAIEQNQFDLIVSQMEALHATIEMTFNGLHIDTEQLSKYTVEVINEFVDNKLTLEKLVSGSVEDVDSPKQWSTFFFGGKKKEKVKEHIGFYKNGKPKTKMVEVETVVHPQTAWRPSSDKIGVSGQVSVDDSVLNELQNVFVSSDIESSARLAVVKNLLKHRELSKQVTTYLQGLGKHIIGSHIHGKLNHTATITGRLSSTSPNLQNISNNPIKKIFVSDFKDGYLVEVDFNQLEVVALAHITGDKTLIHDIMHGVDIHSALYADLYGRLPTKEERKPFKSRTFQLIYGAGPRAIAKQAKCSLEEAQKFVNVFYNRYKDVALWHKNFRLDIERRSSHEKNSEGLLNLFRSTILETETGRRFYFREYKNDNELAVSPYSFSPTELKNYPVQGLATGDIVPMMLGKIFRLFLNNPDVLLVNTVHDSILFDVNASVIGAFIVDIKEILEKTDQYYKTVFKRPFALKLRASVSYGKNWYEMKEIEL